MAMAVPKFVTIWLIILYICIILLWYVRFCLPDLFGISRRSENAVNLTPADINYRDNESHTELSNSSLRKISRTKRATVAELFDPNRRGGLVCSLCIVMDEQFAAAHDLNDRSSIVSTVYKMVDKVSWIFRNIDWNEDGTVDNIGFEIIDLKTEWKPFPDEESYQYDEAKQSLVLLAKFAEIDFRSCCLGLGITNRPFQENQVGVSFIAAQKLLGGVCDYRKPPAPMISPNCALISGRGVGGTLLSLKDVETILIHEMGHAFGVLQHDRDIIQVGSPECSGFLQDDVIPADYLADTSEPPRGRFIMWGQELQGSAALKVHHLKFSPCSRRAVVEIFTTQAGRASCLKQDKTPFCGNGRLEHPEECDCGNEISCSEHKCCGPRGSTAPCKLFKGINTSECVFTKDLNKTIVRKSRSPSSIHAQISYGLLFTGYALIHFVYY